MTAIVPTGRLNRRVTLQTPRTIGDIPGFQPRVFVDGPQLWVHIKRVLMSTRYEATQRIGVVTHQITLRTIKGFSVGYRLVFGARVFEVLSFETCDSLPSFICSSCEEIQR